MEIMERLSALKKYEDDCYSICLYLLQSEKLALEAAKKTMCNLIKCDSFFGADTRTVRDMLRKESMKSALQTRKHFL